jgi:hypothetical protein
MTLPNISFSHEPAVWIGLLTAAIDALVVFFPTAMTPDQKTALIGLVTVLVPVALSFVVRQTSTPNAKLAPAPPAPTLVPPTGGGPSGTP